LTPVPKQSIVATMRSIGIFVLALMTLSTSAFGNDVDDRRLAREHFEKGTRLYEIGHLDEAIKEYEAAYQIKNDPALLYNLAQAHRLAGHLPQALFNYRSYLHRVPEASNRAEVEGRIAELERRIEQSQTEAKPEPTEPIPSPPTKPPEPQEPAVQPSAAAAVVSSPPVPPRNPRRSLKIAGLTLLGVGALGLVGGVTSTALTVVASRNVTQESTQRQAFDPSQQRTGKATQIAADVLYAVGGAAAVTGAVLTYLAYRKPRLNASQASIAPAVAARYVGLAWTGSFE
jgi:tetratricopeptide (TPR) repeat protein